jgi:hypothetical protein
MRSPGISSPSELLPPSCVLSEEIMLESVPHTDLRRESKLTRVQSRSRLADVLERVQHDLETGTVETTPVGFEVETNSTPRWGRSDPCFCGSDEKFSACHGVAIYHD